MVDSLYKILEREGYTPGILVLVDSSALKQDLGIKFGLAKRLCRAVAGTPPYSLNRQHALQMYSDLEQENVTPLMVASGLYGKEDIRKNHGMSFGQIAVLTHDARTTSSTASAHIVPVGFASKWFAALEDEEVTLRLIAIGDVSDKFDMQCGDITLLRTAASIMTTQGDGMLEDLELALDALEQQYGFGSKRPCQEEESMVGVAKQLKTDCSGDDANKENVSHPNNSSSSVSTSKRVSFGESKVSSSLSSAGFKNR